MPNKRSTITRRAALRLLATAGMCALAPATALANAQDDLAATEASLANAQARLEDAQSQLDAIAADYEALSEEQSATLDQLDSVRTQVARVSRRVSGLERNLATKRQELATSVSEEYKDGPHGVVDLILGSHTIDELISNLYYYDKVVEDKARLIEDIKSTKSELEAQQAELEAQQAELESISQVQAEQLEAMRGKQYEAQLVIEGLDEEVRALVAQRDADILAAQQEAEQARREREEAERRAAAEAAAEEARQAEAARLAAEAASAAAQDASDSSQDASAEGQDSEDGGYVASSDYGQADAVASSGVGSAAAVIAACHSTPSPGGGLCAGWCSNVMANAGYGYVAGNANDMYANFCFSSNRSDLMPGMAVAVSTHPHSTAGRIYGHIGMYVGGGMVMDNIGYIRTIGVDEWCAYYGETVSPRWGWLNGIVLR